MAKKVVKPKLSAKLRRLVARYGDAEVKSWWAGECGGSSCDYAGIEEKRVKAQDALYEHLIELEQEVLAWRLAGKLLPETPISLGDNPPPAG